jgi:hypothetical protein
MPGNYLSVFRLKNINTNIEFGDKAYADIKVCEKPEPPKIEFNPKKAEAMERSEMMLDKFENVDKLQKSFEVDEDAQSVESNEIQIIDVIDDPVIQEVEPGQKTQIDNQPLDSQVLI